MSQIGQGRATPGQTKGAEVLDRPIEIVMAIGRCWLMTNEVGIDEKDKAVLAKLIEMCVDKANGAKPVFVRKDTLATALGISEPTLYRRLGKLEKAGLLERYKQNKDNYGCYLEGLMALTRRACGLLGLSDGSPSRAKPAAGQGQETRLSVVSDVYKDYPGIENSYKPKPVQQKVEFKVPEDLRWLIDRELLTTRQLIMLMVKAKKAGQPLQAVIAVKRSSILSGAVGNLGGYLWRLLDQGIDFVHLAAESARHAAGVAKARAKESVVAEFARSVDGQRFRSSNGAIYRVCGEWVEVFKSALDVVPSARGRLGEAFIRGVRSGELAPA